MGILGKYEDNNNNNNHNNKDSKVDDGIKKNIEGHWYWQLKQLKRNV